MILILKKRLKNGLKVKV